MRKIITERILREARIEDQVADALRETELPAGEALAPQISEWLDSNPDRHWTDYVDQIARNIAEPKAAP
jgi:hypothetical protein